MKNVIAIIATILIVLACAYGIYKQVDDFNKKNQTETAYVENNGSVIIEKM